MSDWDDLLAEARVFQTWYSTPGMSVNAWVGVDATSGELYGGWSVEGDNLADEWDESEMMTAAGETPGAVIADLINIARRYRERRDAERAELADDPIDERTDHDAPGTARAVSPEASDPGRAD